MTTVFTYWENSSFRSSPPPYVTLGLASMRRVLGDDLVLLTPSTVGNHVSEDDRDKVWTFGNHRDARRSEIRAIVARSDYLRMRVVEKRGGYWLDADTVVLRDFRETLDTRIGSSSELQWHSEQFFGAAAGNALLREASDRMLEQEQQAWGNPGGLKALIADPQSAVRRIDYGLVGSGYKPDYGYETRDLMLRTDLEPDDFLLNSRQAILKLYNTPLSDTGFGDMGVAEFLDTGILLAKIFLSLDSRESWVRRAEQLEGELKR